MIPNAPRLGDMPKGEPVPDAVYHLRADKAELEASKGGKNPGSPQISVQFTIFGPEEQEQYHGRKVFEIFPLSGEGQYRTRQFLEASGKGEDFVLEDTEQMLGLETGAVVQTEPARVDPVSKQSYDARNRIKKFVPIA